MKISDEISVIYVVLRLLRVLSELLKAGLQLSTIFLTTVATVMFHSKISFTFHIAVKHAIANFQGD